MPRSVRYVTFDNNGDCTKLIFTLTELCFTLTFAVRHGLKTNQQQKRHIHLKLNNPFNFWATSIKFRTFVYISCLHVLTRDQVYWWNIYSKKLAQSLIFIRLICALGEQFTHTFKEEVMGEFSPTAHTAKVSPSKSDGWMFAHSVRGVKILF